MENGPKVCYFLLITVLARIRIRLKEEIVVAMDRHGN